MKLLIRSQQVEAPFTGEFQPVGSFSDFDGESVFGDWTLSITDTAGGDQGTLDGWTIFADLLNPGIGFVPF